MRIKTATFTSPVYFDLTEGVMYIKIISNFHENFVGVILDVDYDEKKGLYKYQCQDWSRVYSYPVFYYSPKGATHKTILYNTIKGILTNWQVSSKDFFKEGKYKKRWKKMDKEWGAIWSGLENDVEKYNQKYFKGNKYKGNAFTKLLDIYAYGTAIEVIRNLVFSQLGYYDIYFNDRGILQIKPYSRTDWEKTGLHIKDDNYSELKLKFSTTNAVTSVYGFNKETKTHHWQGSIGDLSLIEFFGEVGTHIDYSSSTKETKKSTGNTNINKDNPYGKNKKIWIGADGGSGDFCQEIIKLLQKNGWSCHYSGEGANVHYTDLDTGVTGDYSVIAIVDNGFCCTTIKEAYVSFCKSGTPNLKRNGVRVMFMFDTRDWLHENKPYRYGDFNYHVFYTAYDDPTGYCTSMNSTQFFKDWNATYCCHPTAQGIVDQFLAGGICK